MKATIKTFENFDVTQAKRCNIAKIKKPDWRRVVSCAGFTISKTVVPMEKVTTKTKGLAISNAQRPGKFQ